MCFCNSQLLQPISNFWGKTISSVDQSKILKQDHIIKLGQQNIWIPSRDQNYSIAIFIMFNYGFQVWTVFGLYNYFNYF